MDLYFRWSEQYDIGKTFFLLNSVFYQFIFWVFRDGSLVLAVVRQELKYETHTHPSALVAISIRPGEPRMLRPNRHEYVFEPLSELR